MVKPKDESRIRAAQSRADNQWEPEVKFYSAELGKLSKRLEGELSPMERKKVEKEKQHAFDCLNYCQSKMG